MSCRTHGGACGVQTTQGAHKIMEAGGDSEKAKAAESKKIDLKFKFNIPPKKTVINEKNKLKNKGIKTSPKGMKILKLSSKVNELVIQCNPLKKKPKPNVVPKINKLPLKGFFL